MKEDSRQLGEKKLITSFGYHIKEALFGPPNIWSKALPIT